MGESSAPKSIGSAALDVFDARIAAWFRSAFPAPTEIQKLAWPRIAAGEHLLITAPTGSGKTLTAFLWALDRLLTGAWEPGRTRVLYVSPLKALGADIERNLERPLAELRPLFGERGADAGPRVAVRSGDTPQSERRKMLRHPPEILITTPESLNILLTSQGGREILRHLETVLLDEIHAVAGTKRGAHLISAVDRLVPLAGEFQRVALSATVRPLETVARWVGGYLLEGDGTSPIYRPRPVGIVRSSTRKRYEIKVSAPPTAAAEGAIDPEGADAEDDAPWELLASEFQRVVRSNRSTLFFANSRRLTERVTRLINLREPVDLAYSHHGSLSREVRAVVEQRLKEGRLPAIVATSSLELGIDIGDLDEVVLIQTPPSLAAAAQRVGRAGHGVGQVSRARFYPTFGRDFLDAAVAARAVVEGEIEEIRPVRAPLDVLAQVIVSMTAHESWGVGELFARLRASAPFHDLRRAQFDLVLEMLAGRYADSRVRELHPRLVVDRVDGSVRGRPGVARLLYLAGGTIADRGYYALRLESTMAKIGELDEEFVWERSLGDSFTLGAQTWQIRRITHNDVLVAPGRGRAAMAPFWRADALDRGHFFSQKSAALLERVDVLLDEMERDAKGERATSPAQRAAPRAEARLEKLLADEHFLDRPAVAALIEFLRLQRSATGVLPHRRRLLVERIDGGGNAGAEGRLRMVLHTFWGGTVNRPFGLALQAAWEEREGERLDVVHDDDCLMILLPRDVDIEEFWELVEPERVEDLLRRRLEKTGYFGARFRHAAGTALLLPRAGFRHRTPLWLHRRRAKSLLEAVRGYGDFPILVETWRACLHDEFELDALREKLREAQGGEFEVVEVRTSAPSPFAAGLVWQLTNQAMYEDDAPQGDAPGPAVRADLLQELVFSSELRPDLPAALVESFRRKVQRSAAGYAPGDSAEVLHWIGERLLTPEREWRELLSRIEEDHGLAATELLPTLAGRAVWLTLPGATQRGVAGVEAVSGVLARGWAPDELVLGALDDPASSPPDAARDALRRLARPVNARDVETLAPEILDAERHEARVEIVGEILRFNGPLAPRTVRDLLGFDEGDLQAVLETLRDERRVVVDQLTQGARELEICDAENLEILLRWLRREGRVSFDALPVEKLPLFLAQHQGLATRRDGVEGLQSCLDSLFGYPLAAGLWESDVFPARLEPYYPAWLDSLMQESELIWLGCGKERATFAFPADLDLFQDSWSEEEGVEKTEASALLAEPGVRRGLDELARSSGRSTAELSAELWELAWAGRATNTAFAALRQGIETGFEAAAAQQSASSGAARSRPRSAPRFGRRSGDRWRASRSFVGQWEALPTAEEPPDALEAEELAKDRARQLLTRYGIVFRELLGRELPALQWSKVFRALRLMELSGEVLAGRFFTDIPGLQFIAPGAFRELRGGLSEDAVYWLAAPDPASLCGIDLPRLKSELPPRLPSSHVVYHGSRLVLVSRRHGGELDPRVDAAHPLGASYLEVLKVLLTRDARPRSSILVERIGDEAAARSLWAAVLGEIFRVVKEPKGLRLWKRY